MSTAVVGALRVNLSADSAQFTSGLKDAEGSLGKFNAVVGKAMGVVAAFGAAAVAAAGLIAGQMKKSIDAADEMGKAAQKVGLMTEELSALKYTAGLAGVSFESLQTSLVRLTRSMSEVAKGGDNDAAKAFKALGVEVQNTDGSLKSSAQVMEEVADKFATFRDGAEKTALAVAIFGRAGADMIPMLNAGGEAIRKSNDEARDFGVTISEKTAKAAENFNDNMSRLSSMLQGVFTRALASAAPELERLSNAFVEASKGAKGFFDVGDLVSGSIRLITDRSIRLNGELQATAANFYGLKEAATRFVSGDFGGFSNALAKMRDDVYNIKKETQSLLSTLNGSRAWSEGTPILSAEGFSGGKPNKPAAPTLGGGGGGGGAKAATPESVYDEEKAKIEAKLLAIREGMMTEAELKQKKFEDDQNMVDQAFQKEMITAQEHKDMMLDLETKHLEAKRKIQEEYEKTALTGASSMFGSLYSMMGSFGKKNTTLAKALGIAQALINTYTGATQALASAPFPYNMAAFGAVLAKGMSAVAAITSVNTSGGGNSKGGAGGGYSGGGATGASAAPATAGRSMYLTFHGTSYNRDQMRDLAEQMEAFHKDGGGKVIFSR
ncbi:MAG: hypothetical protein Q8M31_04025 [Beijerinckiaceae bacterium]|nr:hypothetical protein [Beijerinckiaceae bacterium]